LRRWISSPGLPVLATRHEADATKAIRGLTEEAGETMPDDQLTSVPPRDGPGSRKLFPEGSSV